MVLLLLAVGGHGQPIELREPRRESEATEEYLPAVGHSLAVSSHHRFHGSSCALLEMIEDP